MQNQLWTTPSGNNPFEHFKTSPPNMVSFTERGHKTDKCGALIQNPEATYFRTTLDNLVIVIANIFTPDNYSNIWRPLVKIPDIVFVGFVSVVKEYENDIHRFT